MKQYEYVNISLDSFFGMGASGHRKVIDDYAEKGYRYAGFIPTNFSGHGKITAIDLIFEIDRPEE